MTRFAEGSAVFHQRLLQKGRRIWEWFLDRLYHESLLYIADVQSDTRVWLERPRVEVQKRRGKRDRHPKRERVIDGEPEPIEVRKVMNLI